MSQTARSLLLLPLLLISVTTALAQESTGNMAQPAGDNAPFERYLAAVRSQRKTYQHELTAHDKRHQEALDGHQHWTNAQGEFIKELYAQHRAALQEQVETQRKQWEQTRQEQDKWIQSRHPAAPQWNNPWYYRGY